MTPAAESEKRPKAYSDATGPSSWYSRENMKKLRRVGWNMKAMRMTRPDMKKPMLMSSMIAHTLK